ncbi:hypothetical protein CORC01_04414 [Colletotrichum orchidophilum]|uniref:Uncharacterized protein n=1 Tax=Colletotrichum orchidophilum TaxID=1209926 RepID=A0A1G4BFT5_9PEZI|nr:uncharacterized protein CORC01_04414 [Colletotrichum orchidophilum]OHF00225.1 hypothetical protein CORC01_04414 [Colletotrichum orchidophilum]
MQQVQTIMMRFELIHVRDSVTAMSIIAQSPSSAGLRKVQADSLPAQFHQKPFRRSPTKKLLENVLTASSIRAIWSDSAVDLLHPPIQFDASFIDPSGPIRGDSLADTMCIAEWLPLG